MQKNFFILFYVLFIGSVAFSAVVKKKPLSTQKSEPVINSTVPTSTPTPAFPDRNLSYYEIGKTDGPVTYTQKIQYEKLPTGNLQIKSTTVDPKGKLMFNETIVTQGSHVISQSADVQQTQRHLELEVKDDHVYFRTRALGPDHKGRTEDPKEDIEKLPPNFITGALVEAFALEHFDELMAGDTVHAKMGIMEIREILSFKFWKKEVSKIDGHEVMVVAMKPSSIFISMLLNNFYLYIDLKEKKMIHFVGRTPLWKEVDGDLKALDSEIVFE